MVVRRRLNTSVERCNMNRLVFESDLLMVEEYGRSLVFLLSKHGGIVSLLLTSRPLLQRL